MVIGLCTVELHLLESFSLKDKRRVLQSLMMRIRNRYNVSVTEVDHQNDWTRATVGIACVCTTSRLATQTLNHIINLIEHEPRVMIEDCSVEML
ncbi:MAG TPA: DUF503 domain-containing protein [Armatimonadetes bacterium]|nr:DUF503 domain-containing protein [Armatimonadota bacterium]